jgi:hypothetical protein
MRAQVPQGELRLDALLRPGLEQPVTVAGGGVAGREMGGLEQLSVPLHDGVQLHLHPVRHHRAVVTLEKTGGAALAGLAVDADGAFAGSPAFTDYSPTKVRAST